MNRSTHRRSPSNGWWWCGIAAILFGASTPAIKRIAGDVAPTLAAGLLYLGAALAVAPRLRRRPPGNPAVTGQRSRLLVAIVVGGGLGPVLLVTGLHRTSAGTAALMLNAELIATALIARVFLHEHVGRRMVPAIALVVAGALVVTGTGTAHQLAGALLVVGACVCWGIDNAITASLDAYPPSTITFVKGVAAGSVNLALGIGTARLPGVGALVGLLVVGAIGYGVSITMWITGARLLGAARGQTIFALAPFVGAALAWPIVGERPTVALAVGFVIALAGVLLASTGHHHHVHRHGATIHVHPIDPADPHHRADAIDLLESGAHRHKPITHDHDHLPDIHHRHEHAG